MAYIRIVFFCLEKNVNNLHLRQCDYLKSKNFKFIEGAEGIHSGTYKVFVNFENYCDITYLSKNICDGMKTIEINKIKYSHPYFIYIDSYRIFTDPIMSFSMRLDKVFNRYTRLYKYYPIQVSDNIKLNIKKTDNNILRLLRKKIILYKIQEKR